MNFTLYALPREPELHLILGRWLMPAPPAVVLIHGRTRGENWYPIHSARISVYYNWDAGGYEIGKRAFGTGGEPVGYINPKHVEVCK